MTNIAKRTIAGLAIVATLGVGTPALAYANTTSTTTSVTVITTMKKWRAADKIYRERLREINTVFLAAVNSAHASLALATGPSSTATERISARAAYRYAITEATINRSNALSLLGNPPVKPYRK
ncbi:MAG TPA: hypothetical protein VMU68_08975 [Acidimicrobiales bacterium]|nr:hypothetical protein [Acidimicrobiales bacterium]